jgi:hypothetical protein
LNEPFAAVTLVTDTLDDLGVPYFIGGSIASTAYGFVRTTLDAYLVADLYPQHIEPLTQALGSAFYVEAGTIREAIEQQGSFSVIHRATMFEVDVFIPKKRLFDQMQFERRVRRAIDQEGRYVVALASAEDVILAKLEWYRLGSETPDRQWGDVQGMLKAQGGRLDLGYLWRWAADLNVADLLGRALDESGW